MVLDRKPAFRSRNSKSEARNPREASARINNDQNTNVLITEKSYFQGVGFVPFDIGYSDFVLRI